MTARLQEVNHEQILHGVVTTETTHICPDGVSRYDPSCVREPMDERFCEKEGRSRSICADAPPARAYRLPSHGVDEKLPGGNQR